MIHIAVTAGLSAMLAMGPAPSIAAAEQLDALDAAAADTDTATAPDQTTAAEEAATGATGQEPGNDASDGDAAREIASVDDPQPFSTVPGSVALPSSVTARYSDESTDQVPVDWTLDGVEATEGLLSSLGEGTYTFLGAVEGYDGAVECTVQVTGGQVEGADQAASAAASADSDHSIEIDGTTVIYSTDLTIPVGFSLDALFSSNVYEGYARFTVDGGTWSLPLETVWGDEARTLDTSQPTTLTKQYTLTQNDSVPSILYGRTFTFKLSVAEPQGGVQTQLNLSYYAAPSDSFYIQPQQFLFDDGSTFMADIAWDDADYSDLMANTENPGTYTLHGHYLAAPSINVTCIVWIQGIREIAPVTVYTAPGSAPVLPDTVNVEYEDGGYSTKAVTWDAIDPDQYATKTTFGVMGTVDGTDIRARAEVMVSDIVSIEQASVATSPNTPPDLESVGVGIQYELGYTYVYPQWEKVEAGDSRLAEQGSFDIHGTLPGYSMDFTCTVSVVDITDYPKEITQKTCVGMLSYPYGVDVTTSDGKSMYIKVDWDESGQYWELAQHVGKFDIKGTIAGSHEIVMHVDVMNIKGVEGVAESYSTPEGVLPSLPNQVRVVLSDGSTMDYTQYLNWQLPNPDTIKADASPITVTGTLSNGYTVSTKVNVSWTLPQGEPEFLSTLVGIIPDLPDTVDMAMSDGTVRSLAAQWQNLDPNDFQTPGSTVTVNGFITGSNVPISAEIAVCNPSDDPVDEQDVFAGCEPYYPVGTIRIELDNGDSFMPDYGLLHWNEIDPSTLVAGSTQTVTGGIYGSPAQLKLQVNVLELDRLQSDHLSSFMFIGENYPIENMLPPNTMGISPEGVEAPVFIDWDLPSEEQLAVPGHVEVKGTAAGIPVTCDLTVAKAVRATIPDPVPTITGLTSLANTSIVGDVEYECGDETGTMSTGIGSITLDDPGILSQAGTHHFTGKTMFCGAMIPVEGEVSVYTSAEPLEEPRCWTVPGAYPDYPYAIKVKLTGEDGATETTTMYASWSYSENFAQSMVGDTVEVTGTITDINMPITCEVEVRSVSSVTVSDVKTALGSLPELPRYGVATLDDGSTRAVPVEWTSSFSSTDFDVAGATRKADGIAYIPGYSGTATPVSCTVTATGARGVEESASAQLQQLVTQPGVFPSLPGTVPVTLDDGSVISAQVEWDTSELTAADFSEPGKEVSIDGTVTGIDGAPSLFSLLFARGDGADVHAKVRVADADEKPTMSFAYPVYITVPANEDDLETLLEKSAPTFCLSDGSVGSYEVDWDVEGKKLDKPGTYALQGTVKGLDGRQVTAYVTVTSPEEARVPESIDEVELTLPIPEGGFTRESFSQELPTRVKVRYSDGTDELLPVNWILNGITAENLKNPGNITLKGNVGGLSITAKATVTLVAGNEQTEVYPTGLAKKVEVTTPQTFQPVLPETVDIKMSDGSTKTFNVTWEKIDPGELQVMRQITVNGVYGEGWPCKATVNVVEYVPVTDITWSCPDQLQEEGPIRLEPNGSTQITADVEPDNASFQDVTFSSSDEDVVMVGADGAITAVSEGEATIILKAQGKTVSIPVTVSSGNEPEPEPDPTVPVTSVTISGESVTDKPLELKRGQSTGLDAEVLPEDATDKSVEWSSSDPSVASVDADGTVTALKGGTATITAKSGSAMDTIQVTVPRTETGAELLVNGSPSPLIKVDLNQAFDPSTLSFTLVTRYDDGSMDTRDIDASQVGIEGGVDASVPGTHQLKAIARIGNDTYTCTFTVEVIDPGTDGGDGPAIVQKPAGGQADGSETDDGTAEVDSAEQDDAMPRTGDPSTAVAAIGGAGALLTALGAWIERRRVRRS